MSFHVPNRHRVRTGPFGSDETAGNNGAFFVPNRGGATPAARATPLKVIASDGEGWEHVSVSLPNRCPTWAEMSFIKATFWDSRDCVVQFHPSEYEYVNNHAFCLHLWRPTAGDIPTPPAWMVGIKGLTPEQSEQALAAGRISSPMTPEVAKLLNAASEH